jgi:hypothetical protein
MLKEWNLTAFQNSWWTIHLEEQDPLDTQSYAGRINLSNIWTERIQRSKPWCLWQQPHLLQHSRQHKKGVFIYVMSWSVDGVPFLSVAGYSF